MEPTDGNVKTDLSLGRKYDVLASIADEAASLRVRSLAGGPINSHIDLMSAWFMVWVAKRTNFLTDTWNATGEAVEYATDEMKENPLFPAAIDEYWPEELGRYIVRKLALDRNTVDGLLRVQEIREQQNRALSSTWRTPLVWIGSVVTVAALAANQVPKEVFEHLGSQNYVAYRYWVFIALAICVGSIVVVAFIIFLIGSGAQNRQVKGQLALNRGVLLYIEALLAEGRTEGAETSPASSSKGRVGFMSR
jgi:hypothetical protein